MPAHVLRPSPRPLPRVKGPRDSGLQNPIYQLTFISADMLCVGSMVPIYMCKKFFLNTIVIIIIAISKCAGPTHTDTKIYGVINFYPSFLMCSQKMSYKILSVARKNGMHFAPFLVSYLLRNVFK